MQMRREQPIAPRNLTIDLGRNRVGVANSPANARAEAEMYAAFAPVTPATMLRRSSPGAF